MGIDYHTDSSDDQIEDKQIAPSTSKKCYDHKYNYMWEKQEHFKKWPKVQKVNYIFIANLVIKI